jgi:hypothetical protein
VTADGYCETCGKKVPAGDDHTEIDLGIVAGVTDRGLRHHRNEDAMEPFLIRARPTARRLTALTLSRALPCRCTQATRSASAPGLL